MWQKKFPLISKIQKEWLTIPPPPTFTENFLNYTLLFNWRDPLLRKWGGTLGGDPVGHTAVAGDRAVVGQLPKLWLSVRRSVNLNIGIITSKSFLLYYQNHLRSNVWYHRTSIFNSIQPGETIQSYPGWRGGGCPSVGQPKEL